MGVARGRVLDVAVDLCRSSPSFGRHVAGAGSWLLWPDLIPCGTERVGGGDGATASAKGDPGKPPLALFKTLLLAAWHDLTDVRLAEALDDRASFRRFCVIVPTSPRPSAPPLCASAPSSAHGVCQLALGGGA